ncbi:MAG: tyrosinase family protein [Pseudomonas fluorescens]
MAQFDASKTVNNILSGNGDTAQQLVGKVIRTAADLAALPDVDGASLAKLPGVGNALGVAPDLGGVLGRGGPQRQAPKPVQKSQFSAFSIDAMRGARAMAAKLMEIADRKGGDAGLADAVGALGSLGELLGGVSGLAGDLADDLTAEVSEIVGEVGVDVLGLIGLRQYALQLFITHYPPAREKFKMEPLEQRQPNAVSRSRAQATPPEDRVSFWREDAQLNDHHGHWHVVYPLDGRPVAGGEPDMGDRHGELFVFMHVQMLARYDAERLGAGLPRVKPLDDFRAPIPEGYDPGDLTIWFGEQWMGFSARPANATLRDLAPPLPEELRNRSGATLEAMDRFRNALLEAARRGSFEVEGKQIAITNYNFGDTLEANRDSVSGSVYGDHHNDGHIHIGFFDNSGNAGVLVDLPNTSRDPAFWRWHKHIDNIAQTWRETLGKQQPHDFADGPSVAVRSEDIILCGEEGLPGMEGLPADFDEGRLGAAAFGYSEDPNLNRWDDDFSSGPVTLTVALPNNETATKTITTTAELMTEMRTRTIQVRDPQGQLVPEDVDYLSHEDFYYFLRLQNRSEQAQQVTIRIFLAPEPWVEDNTAWIELDRFLHRLAGREHAVIFRPARLSAVIRKPALGHAELESTEPRPPATTWCDCGWPYNLLLPRSTKEGLDFQLLVMLSSDDLVMTDTGQECTSMSYCGLQDKNYPDKRLMGYPFDRPLTDSIDSIIDKHENWASRTVRIRCRNL